MIRLRSLRLFAEYLLLINPKNHQSSVMKLFGSFGSKLDGKKIPMQAFKIKFVQPGSLLKKTLVHAFAIFAFVVIFPAFGSFEAQCQTLPDSSVVQQPGTPQSSPTPAEDSPAARQLAAEQLKQEEHQRILGFLPNFNTTNIHDAVALTSKQKFQLAFRSSVDPVQFVVAAFDASLSQAFDDYHGYGQGAQGYFKRWGAAYLDNFDGTLLGGAVFPALLHQDPRYFRKGTGTIKRRLLYSIATTAICKNDNGKWVPNYSNVLGNLAAGGIANAYYPSTDRGVELTFERAFTVTAEGALGAMFVEFWPDISRKVFHKH